jgi:hypothetical protein
MAAVTCLATVEVSAGDIGRDGDHALHVVALVLPTVVPSLTLATCGGEGLSV